MPRLTYTPEGADPKVWDFSFGRIKFGERAAIEKATGLGWQGVEQGFFLNKGEVIHALLWVMLKRDIPTLRSVEVDFMDDEIDIDVTDDEACQALAVLSSKSALNDVEAEALAELQKRFAGGDEADAPAEESGPKED